MNLLSKINNKNKSTKTLHFSSSPWLLLPMNFLIFPELIIFLNIVIIPSNRQHIIPFVFKHLRQELIRSNGEHQNNSNYLLIAGLVVEVK